MQRLRHLQGVGPSFRSSATRLGGLLALQAALGGLAWWYRTHVGIVTLHVGMGSLVLAQAVLLAMASEKAAS